MFPSLLSFIPKTPFNSRNIKLVVQYHLADSMPSGFPSFHNAILPSNLVPFTKFDVEPILFLGLLSFMSVYSDNVEINLRI